jgi:hypothetical protein
MKYHSYEISLLLLSVMISITMCVQEKMPDQDTSIAFIIKLIPSKMNLSIREKTLLSKNVYNSFLMEKMRIASSTTTRENSKMSTKAKSRTKSQIDRQTKSSKILKESYFMRF